MESNKGFFRGLRWMAGVSRVKTLLMFIQSERIDVPIDRGFTPWKINMEPSNHPLRKEHDLPNLHDYVPAVNFQGCTTWDSSSSYSPSIFLHEAFHWIWILQAVWRLCMSSSGCTSPELSLFPIPSSLLCSDRVWGFAGWFAVVILEGCVWIWTLIYIYIYLQIHTHIYIHKMHVAAEKARSTLVSPLETQQLSERARGKIRETVSE